MREAAVAEREAARGPAEFTPNVKKLVSLTPKIGSRHEVPSASALSKEDLAATRTALKELRKTPKEKMAFPMRESDELGWMAEEFAAKPGREGEAEGVGMGDARLPKRTCDETRWAMAYYTRHACTNPFSKAVSGGTS